MTGALVCLAVGVLRCVFCLYYWGFDTDVSPDGKFYLDAAAGEKTPLPFSLRTCLPGFIGARVENWLFATTTMNALLPVCCYTMLMSYGISRWPAVVISCLYACLPFICLSERLPVLLDSYSHAAILLCAACWFNGFTVWAIALTFVGGMITEKTPFFAALTAQAPLLLIGVLVPLISLAFFWPRKPKGDEFPLMRPALYAKECRKGEILSAKMILPWGALLFLALLSPSWWLFLSLAFAYSQISVATDCVRLYQLAAPAVCLSASAGLLLVPPVLWLPVVFYQWFMIRNDWLA